MNKKILIDKSHSEIKKVSLSTVLSESVWIESDKIISKKVFSKRVKGNKIVSPFYKDIIRLF